MFLTRTFKIIPLLALLFLPGTPSAAQDTPSGADTSEIELIDMPLLVFRKIEMAWQAGNAQALAGVASKSRVFMEIRGIDQRGGYFTRPQLQYIFKNMFASTSHTSFTFVKYHNLGKRDSKIYGMALRSYKSNRGGGLCQDRVYVTLVKEGSRWAMAEIKSSW